MQNSVENVYNFEYYSEGAIFTDIKDGNITLGEVVATIEGKALLMREFPDVAGSPLFVLAKKMTLNTVIKRWGNKVSAEKIASLTEEIKKIGD